MKGKKRQPVTAILAFCLAAAAGSVAAEPAPNRQVWQTDQYSLQRGESLQFRVDFAEIPVRSWMLVVQGDQVLCDVHVLRMRNNARVYAATDESRHEITVPWGLGEEVSIVLTARRRAGVFAVSYLGPPPESAPASYSYPVNRALEAYTAGRRDEAELLCRDALREDAGDGVARVILAGLLGDRGFLAEAAQLVQEALSLEMPPEMQQLARQLEEEIGRLRGPEMGEVDADLARAVARLEEGDPAGAVEICDRLLGGTAGLTGPVRSRILRVRGRALHGLGRYYQAVENFTRALDLASARTEEALVYYRMGRLFLDMGNLPQAQGALQTARDYGLPAHLDLEAAQALERIESG